MKPFKPVAQLPFKPLPGTHAPETPVDSVEDAPRVLTETQRAFKAVEGRVADQMRLATDSEYWVAVCFSTREQKEEFLRVHGLLDLGDKYVDGREVSRRMGKPLTSPSPKIPRATINTRLEALARTRT